MQKEQPEALRLADALDAMWIDPALCHHKVAPQVENAGAALRNLHTENTALRVNEENLRQELQECQEQRRAAFRRIEELDRELDAMRAQIGQGEPSQAASDAYDRIDHFLRQKLDDHDYTHYSFDLDLVWGAAPAPQQKPLTDEQIKDCLDAADQMYCPRDGDKEIFKARAIEAAHNIGEKK